MTTPTEARRLSITVDDETFHAVDHGAVGAPVVLCLHGFPDHARSFDLIAPAIVAAGYRCVAPWLRGYSPSTLQGPFDIDRIAADIVGIKRAVSADQPAILIGHDWGAVAGYAAVARAPDDFSHAITMAVPHPLALLRNLRRHPQQLRLSWYMAFFQLRGVADVAVKRDKLAFIDRLWRDWSPGYALPSDSMRDLKRCLSASLPAPLEYYRAMFSLRPSALKQRQALIKATRRIQVPTLYLHGEQDGCMLYAMGDGQGRFFDRGFETHCVARAGHFLHLEAPDVVAGHIMRFLNAPQRQRLG